MTKINKKYLAVVAAWLGVVLLFVMVGKYWFSGKVKSAITSTPRMTDDEANKYYLVGIWQNSPTMNPGGWNDHYNFYPDGTYRLYYDTMDCAKRKVRQSGTWVLKGDSLTLTTTEEKRLMGGEMVTATGACTSSQMLSGAKEETVALDKPTKEDFRIEKLPWQETENNESMRLKDKDGKEVKLWKFNNDPTDGGNFWDKL
jgi:hypothetical protein